MFDFKELEAFVWIVRLGSFRMAARYLHLTQPSISDRISRLEETLGDKVLERTQRPIQPTLRGRELFRQAEQMLYARQRAMELFRTQSDFKGAFHLGVVETIAHSWLPSFLTELSRRFPAMTLELEVDTTPRLQQRLAAHELDLAFLMGPVQSEGILSQFLCKNPVGFIAHPEILAEYQRDAEDLLQRYPLITFSRDSHPYRELQNLLHDSGQEQVKVHCSSSLWTIVRLTQERFGIGMIPPIIVADELTRGELVLLNLDLHPPALSFTASWPNSHDAHIAESVVQLANEFAVSE